MILAELGIGEYAITDNGLAVLGLSDRSFKPLHEDDANVVHIANGIGAFRRNTRCNVVSAERAFEVAMDYRLKKF